MARAQFTATAPFWPAAAPLLRRPESLVLGQAWSRRPCPAGAQESPLALFGGKEGTGTARAAREKPSYFSETCWGKRGLSADPQST